MLHSDNLPSTIRNIPESSASGFFLKLPHYSTDLECFGSFFNWAGGGVGDSHAAQAIKDHSSSSYLNIPHCKFLE
jgi:hypothetical protein